MSRCNVTKGLIWTRVIHRPFLCVCLVGCFCFFDMGQGSINTYGTEHLFANFNNCLQVFASSLKLRISRRFLQYDFLFPNAVEVPDWNHQLAGALKAALSALDTWPGKLRALRAWCNFFRDNSHREAVAVYLISIDNPREASLLDKFTASFAHWRYQCHRPGIMG